MISELVSVNCSLEYCTFTHSLTHSLAHSLSLSLSLSRALFSHLFVKYCCDEAPELQLAAGQGADPWVNCVRQGRCSSQIHASPRGQQLVSLHAHFASFRDNNIKELGFRGVGLLQGHRLLACGRQSRDGGADSTKTLSVSTALHRTVALCDASCQIVAFGRTWSSLRMMLWSLSSTSTPREARLSGWYRA